MDASSEFAAADAEWIIEPRRSGLLAHGREFWRYRRLLRFFAAKSLQKLYQPTPRTVRR